MDDFKLPPHDVIVYTAGLVDGEGSIQIQNVGPLSLCVASTYRDVLVWLVEQWGGNIYNLSRKHPKCLSKRQVFIWYAPAKRHLHIIEAIRPYLIIKAAEADVAIRYGHLPGVGVGKGHGKNYGVAVDTAKRKLFLLIRELRKYEWDSDGNRIK